jgi:hypothetical protein
MQCNAHIIQNNTNNKTKQNKTPTKDLKTTIQITNLRQGDSFKQLTEEYEELQSVNLKKKKKLGDVK